MMSMEVRGEQVYCGRPGCWRLIGAVRGERPGGLDWGPVFFHVELLAGPREGWLAAYLEGGGNRQVWTLRRRRRATRLTAGVVAPALVDVGDVVECPRCRSRQIVPAIASAP